MTLAETPLWPTELKILSLEITGLFRFLPILSMFPSMFERAMPC